MNFLKKLRIKFNDFCYRHSNWGIPNLMLFVTIGCAIVYVMSMINGGEVLYYSLCFDKQLILRGQVWRLVTFVFTYAPGSGFLAPIFLYFFYSLGRFVERQVGTLRFNIFYFTGVILMDAFAMIFLPKAVPAEQYVTIVQTYSSMGYYLHLSLLLAFATLNPDSQFLLLFIIPIKAWIMGIVYLVFISVDIFNASYPVFCFPHNLFPLIALANYFIFFDVRNLFSRRRSVYRRGATAPVEVKKAKPKAADYQHRCVICGRTDVSHPELEFRYCSKCNGYFCYCEDHINNHTHIQ